MKDTIKLFFTAFLQVTLVAMNVTFISHGMILAMALTGFGISYLWTGNIKKVAFGSQTDKLIYSSGAMVGTLTGYYLAKFLTILII